MIKKLTLALGALSILCGPASSQSASQPAGQAPPQFDIAGVHLNSGSSGSRGLVLHGGRFSLRNINMIELILLAYNVDPDQLIGGPQWLARNRFDILARAKPGTPPATLRLMLRSLLADRFKLAVRTDSAPLPLYVLSAGSGKPKLRASDGAGKGCMLQASKPGSIPGYSISCRNATMEQFVPVMRASGAEYLRDSINFPAGRIADRTGLTGAWDFDIKWTAFDQLKEAGPDGAGLFDALDKQLGLKLERTAAPTPVIVVESVNPAPSPDPPGAEAALKPLTEFEVASIRPSMPGAPKRMRVQNDRVDMQAYTLLDLIDYAWNINAPVADRVIAGIPKFATTTAFEVQAKASEPMEDADELRTMLQTLLRDRFQLKVHTEDRLVETYVLTAAKPKLKPPEDPSAITRCVPGPGPEREVICKNMTVSEFASTLINARGDVDLPVLDATGIEGRWDFNLRWISSAQLASAKTASQSAGDAPAPAGGLSLPEAIEKEFGLKMELKKRPFPVLVIDHVEKMPTEN